MQEIFEHLSEVFACNAFELCRGKTEEEYLIPYMMNDALEYYFVLKNCKMTGEYLPDTAIDSVQIEQEENRYVLIIRQENGNTFTLLFQEIEEQAKCYQYHRIGHFWVKGKEPWRRLVYIIGTIYDKYEFFGERFCNEKELELMYLIRFAPFRMWSPVSDSLKERYPDSEKGMKLMEQLAQEAGDKKFLRWLWCYQKFPVKWLEKCLGKEMTKASHQKLYEVICSKIEMASLMYPQRDYGETLNKEIHDRRKHAHEFLLEQGYQGVYPNYRKGKAVAFAAEEHPFTIMEWEDFRFRIQLMEMEGTETTIREVIK